MTTNPSIWRIEGPEIVEQPTMQEPVLETSLTDDLGNEHKREEHAAYYKHLASLRRYPHNLPDSLKGKDLREGIDFWLGKHWSNGMVWFPASDETYDSMPDNRRSIIALPISQPEQQNKSKIENVVVLRSDKYNRRHLVSGEMTLCGNSVTDGAHESNDNVNCKMCLKAISIAIKYKKQKR